MYVNFCINPCQLGLAVLSPESIDVSVGDTATFECEVSNFSPDFVIWNLNQVQIEDYHEVAAKQSLRLSSNTIVATIEIWPTVRTKNLLNNSQIYCEAIDLLGNMYSSTHSETAVLKVQDILSAPADLTAFFNRNSLFLQWSPPYTLPGVSITSYLVETTKVIGMDVYEHFLTNESMRSLHMPDEIDCTEYQICVSAETAAGVGERACTFTNRTAGGMFISMYIPHVAFYTKLGCLHWYKVLTVCVNKVHKFTYSFHKLLMNSTSD